MTYKTIKYEPVISDIESITTEIIKVRDQIENMPGSMRVLPDIYDLENGIIIQVTVIKMNEYQLARFA